MILICVRLFGGCDRLNGIDLLGICRLLHRSPAIELWSVGIHWRRLKLYLLVLRILVNILGHVCHLGVELCSEECSSSSSSSSSVFYAIWQPIDGVFYFLVCLFSSFFLSFSLSFFLSFCFSCPSVSFSSIKNMKWINKGGMSNDGCCKIAGLDDGLKNLFGNSISGNAPADMKESPEESFPPPSFLLPSLHFPLLATLCLKNLLQEKQQHFGRGGS